MSNASILLWTLIYGILWNALGWAGNNILLGAGWDAVSAQTMPDFAAPWPRLARELATFASDFVYAFAFVWLLSRAVRKTVGEALSVGAVLWLAGPGVTYLAIVNSGFLPWRIAVETSALALAIFLATAPLLPLALRRAKSGG